MLCLEVERWLWCLDKHAEPLPNDQECYSMWEAPENPDSSVQDAFNFMREAFVEPVHNILWSAPAFLFVF